jgi:hypothetical protein
LCASFALLAPGAASSASHPLVTAVEQPNNSPTADMGVANDRIRKLTGYTRIILYWNDIAPTRPANPTDPNDPAYDWTDSHSRPDQRVLSALDAGLTPLVTVWKAPRWAEDRSKYDGLDGTVKPSASAFGDFAQALQKHYPRVHLWEAWNEPNQPHFLNPQTVGGKPYSPEMYRHLLNAFADGIHHVNPNARVAGGALSPRFKLAPLVFMRSLFCLDAGNKPITSCPVHLDAWSHHPYTNGGPFKKQGTPDGVSLGDLPRMRATLRAADAAKDIVTSKPSVEFWVSEFSWDTDGPDPDAVPLKLHTRWVAEALYQAYRSGVSLFVWHQLRDRPLATQPYQSGFYYCGRKSVKDDSPSGGSYCGDGNMLDRDAKKTSSIRAFRFPFVAYAKNGHVRVWGRTTDSAAHSVAIKRLVSGHWRLVKTLQSDGNGIFSSRWRSSDRSHRYEALVSSLGAHSAPFSLRKPKPFTFEKSMWGCGGFIAC